MFFEVLFLTFIHLGRNFVVRQEKAYEKCIH